MLKFQTPPNDEPQQPFRLGQPAVLGADEIGIPATIELERELIIASKSSLGPASLSLQADADAAGQLILNTCLLPERDEPYTLTLELARNRIMRCLAKQEEWAMFDIRPSHPAAVKLAAARELFVEALSNSDNPELCEQHAKQALIAAIDASEELALTHANGLLKRRWRYGQLDGNIFGIGVDPRLDPATPAISDTIRANFNYVRLPMTWRGIEPEETKFNWQRLDAWTDWAQENRIPIVGGPLVDFSPAAVPDWLYIWEHDHDTLTQLIQEHIERLVTRYRGSVSLWNVASGLHVNENFPLNFEQVMDLTRTASTLTRKVHPTGRTMIEITQPFGEYYATNPRSIPPLMFAEMTLQSGIPFDALGIRLISGYPQRGHRTRDLMQVSAMLDRFNALGKPLHITAVAAPAETVEQMPQPPSMPGADQKPAEPNAAPAGYWRNPWSQDHQALWLEAIMRIALSKPYVESAAWLDLTDHDQSIAPNSGLLDSENKPRYALKKLTALRRSFEDYDE